MYKCGCFIVEYSCLPLWSYYYALESSCPSFRFHVSAVSNSNCTVAQQHVLFIFRWRFLSLVCFAYVCHHSFLSHLHQAWSPAAGERRSAGHVLIGSHVQQGINTSTFTLTLQRKEYIFKDSCSFSLWLMCVTFYFTADIPKVSLTHYVCKIVCNLL